MSSSEYSSVTTDLEFEHFLAQVDELHDGIVREAVFVARGYVDANRTMWGDAEPADLVVVIQLQSPSSPVVELLLTEVTLCTITTAATTMAPEIAFSNDGITLYLEGRNRRDTSHVVAGRLFYRVLDDRSLGPVLRWTRPLSIAE